MKEPVMGIGGSGEDENETKREDAPIFLLKRQTKPEAKINAVLATPIQTYTLFFLAVGYDCPGEDIADQTTNWQSANAAIDDPVV